MTKVEPIRDPQKLAAIKRRLRAANSRWYTFFVLGINTALRPGDLLRLRAGDLYERDGTVRLLLYVKAQKTEKTHRIKLNDAATEALEILWREAGPFEP